MLSWNLINTMNADWCAELLTEILKKYGKPNIFSTDQKSQYTSEVHTKVLISNDMKNKGRANDLPVNFILTL